MAAKQTTSYKILQKQDSGTVGILYRLQKCLEMVECFMRIPISDIHCQIKDTLFLENPIKTKKAPTYDGTFFIIEIKINVSIHPHPPAASEE